MEGLLDVGAIRLSWVTGEQVNACKRNLSAEALTLASRSPEDAGRVQHEYERRTAPGPQLDAAAVPRRQ